MPDLGNEIQPSIESFILNIRRQQVMLYRDLAHLYGVETKALIKLSKEYSYIYEKE